MLKILKKLLIISLILLIQSVIVIYKIISKFWRKYNINIKDFVRKLDKELKVELQWKINLELVKLQFLKEILDKVYYLLLSYN